MAARGRQRINFVKLIAVRTTQNSPTNAIRLPVGVPLQITSRGRESESDIQIHSPEITLLFVLIPPSIRIQEKVNVAIKWTFALEICAYQDS